MTQFTEPEIGHRRQYASFVGYWRRQHNDERGKSIGLDNQHAVCINLVEIPHLPAMHEFERLETCFVEGLMRTHGWRPARVKFRIIPAGSLLLPHRIASHGRLAGGRIVAYPLAQA